MSTPHANRACLLMAVLLAMVSSPAAQADPARAMGEVYSALVRTISLEEIGYREGLRFGALGGEQEVFFPAPASVRYRSARVLLRTKTAELWPGAARHFEVLVNGRSVLAVSGPRSGEAHSMAIPLSPGDLGDGDFVRLTLRSSGVIAAERCLNLSRALDHVTILPETALELEIERDSLDSPGEIMKLLPRRARIELPRRELEPVTVAAALTLARHLRQMGRDVAFAIAGQGEAGAVAGETGRSHWREATFALTPPVELAALGDAPAVTARIDMSGLAGSLRVTHRASGPAILLGGGNPQLAAAALADPWQEALPGSLKVGALKAPKPRGGALTFASLGLKPGAQVGIDETAWAFAIPARIAPEGKRISALELHLAAAPDDTGQAPVASVFVNGRLAASALIGSSEPVRLVAELPADTLGVENGVRVVVQRSPSGGDCRTEPRSYPADLIDQSRVRFANAGPPRRFADFAATIGNELTVSLPANDPEKVIAALPLLSETISRLTGADARITVRFGQPLAAGGFVHFGDAPPLGFEPPARFDAKTVEIGEASGKIFAELAGERDVASVQMIVRSGRAAGLWVKPASRLLDPGRLDFSRGNVSLLHEDGSVSFSTRPGAPGFVLPERADLADLWRDWANVLIVVAWIAATVVFVSGLKRLGATRRRDDA